MTVSKIINKIKNIEVLLNNSKKLIDAIDTNSNLEVFELFDNFLDFIYLISIDNVQSKTPQVEKFVAKKMGLKKISSSEDSGDFIDNKENTYELKVSFAEKDMNLRQIRLYQNIDTYICIHIDEKDPLKSKCFTLSKKQMEDEVSKIGGYTHGTIKANLNNKNKEYSVTINMKPKINIENSNLTRWEEKYLNKELYNKIILTKN